MTEKSGASGLARYWPVLAAVAVLALVLATMSIVRGGEESASTGPGGPQGSGGRAPALAAFGDTDPLGAPDCDRETGKLKIPSVFTPNCVPLWPDGRDNGGATAKQGVTADKITVAVYVPQRTATGIQTTEALGIPNLPDEELDEYRNKVLKTYNDLYETYGRRVELVRLNASGSNSDDAAAKADAIKVASEIKAFAVINGPTGTNAFADELVARGVLCMCAASAPQEQYEKWQPYVWGTLMSSTQGYIHRAELIKALAGKPAQHAGDQFKSTPRKFAVVYFETVDNSYRQGVEFFENLLRESNISLAAKIPYVFDSARAAEDARNIIARLKADGVTSVIYAGDPTMPRFLGAEATSQDYFPEWVLTGSTLTDSTGIARLNDQAQWRHAFGLSFGNARIDPTFLEQEGNLVSWHNGEELPTYPDILAIGRFFTGVHLAGPTLNEQTFRDALFAFKPLRGLKTWQATSFGTGLWPFPDYTAYDDVTLIWWDPDATGPNEGGTEGKGMFRYVDEGKRYLPGELTNANLRFFDPAGTSTVLPERPAGDRTPTYPRRKGREG
jgi:hypothetical protein